MLNDAIAEEKGEAPKKSACTVDIKLEAHIPESYISSMTSRLEIYRRIALVRTQADKTDMVDELIDRFGDPPQSLLNLIDVSLCRNIAGNLGITEINQKRGAMFFYVTAPKRDQLAALMRRYYDRIAFNDRTLPYYISIKPAKGETSVQLMRDVIGIFLENA